MNLFNKIVLFVFLSPVAVPIGLYRLWLIIEESSLPSEEPQDGR